MVMMLAHLFWDLDWDFLGNFNWHLGAVFLWYVITIFMRNLDWNLLWDIMALFPWHLVALLVRDLDWDFVTRLLRYRVAVHLGFLDRVFVTMFLRNLMTLFMVAVS